MRSPMGKSVYAAGYATAFAFDKDIRGKRKGAVYRPFSKKWKYPCEGEFNKLNLNPGESNGSHEALGVTKSNDDDLQGAAKSPATRVTTS